MRRWLLVPLAFVFLASSAGAVDVAPITSILANGCSKLTLCDSEADIGVCKNVAGTANIVANIAGRYAMTVYATSSAATVYTCDLYTSDNGYQATKRTAITAAASNTNLDYVNGRFSVSVSGTFADIWVECPTAITGAGGVTINAYVCPLATK